MELKRVCRVFRLSSLDVVVSLVLLVAQRLGSHLHPDRSRALQHRRADRIHRHHQDLLVVPHHGQHTCRNTHIIILLVNSTFSDESIDCLIPFISSFNFGVYFCSGAASGFQQLPVEGMVELNLQFPGAERSDHGSHRVLVAGGPAFLLQTEVQDRGGGEGRMRNPAH